MLKNWLVAYTKPRHEKKSADVLRLSGIDVFLPLQRQLKEWSDRKKWVEWPIFPGYIFVNVEEKDQLTVLNSFGIVKFIRFAGKPAVVREDVIFNIKKILSSKVNFEIEICDTAFLVGQEILIKKGPLKGIKGKYVDFKGKNKIAIEIECMNNAVLVDINKSDLS